MKKDFAYLSVIAALSALTVTQEIRIRQLAGTYAGNFPTKSLSAEAKAVAASADRPLKHKPAIPASESLPPSQDKVPGAEVSIIDGIKKERALKIQQGIDSRILALRGSLNLTDEQELQIRAVTVKWGQKLEEMSRSKPEKGAAFKAYLEKGAAIQTAQEEEIGALLTEDQRVALEDHKLKERQTQAETKAGQQLAVLQTGLTLTEEQKDAVFQMYATQSLDFDPVKIIKDGRDPGTVMEQQLLSSREKLQQILTPEQYQLFIGQEIQRKSLERARGF